MPRLLYTWEYGANLGHVSNFLPIALAMKDKGWEVIFAIPTRVNGINSVMELLQQHAFEFVQGPGRGVLGETFKTVSNHADLLDDLVGLRNQSELGFFYDAWTAILDKIQPDLVVADFSVTPLMAAKAKNIPTVIIDQGWFVPDLVSTDEKLSFQQQITPIRTGDSDSDSCEEKTLAEKEQSTLDRFNAVLSERGQPELTSFVDIYKCDEIILTNFYELSPLKHADKSKFVGTLDKASQAKCIDWPNATLSKPKIFVYLQHTSPTFRYVIDVLKKETNYSVIAYIPGVHKKFAELHQTEHFHISLEPVNVPHLLRDANLVISNAGAGLTAQSLLAGVPMVLVPQWTEQRLNASRVRELQAGEAMDYTYSEVDVESTISRVLGNQIYLAKAREFKLNNQAADIGKVVERIETCYQRTSQANVKDQATAAQTKDDDFASFSDYDWFYLAEKPVTDDATWALIEEHIPNASVILVEEDFASAVDIAAKQARSERFITLKQGYELNPYSLIAESDCPVQHSNTHWYWNTLDSITGLVHASSALVCWNTKLANQYPLSQRDSSKQNDEIHSFLREADFSAFAKVMTESARLGQPVEYFQDGYRSTLNILSALRTDIARIIRYPASTLVRRLFIHMSSGNFNTEGKYHLLGARLAFVNLFVRFKRGCEDISSESANAMLQDGLHYLGLANESCKLDSLDMEQLEQALTQMGEKIQGIVSNPPLLDMSEEDAAGFKDALMTNRAEDFHLFEPYNISKHL